MELIKTISGRILLYFYLTQREDYAKLNDLILSFQMRHFSDPNERSPKISARESEIVQNLLKIAGNDNDIYNALIYLKSNGLIEITKRRTNVEDHFLNLSVSGAGVDMIEAIERGPDERGKFNITFNIKLADNIKVESLIKAELGGLIRLGLL